MSTDQSGQLQCRAQDPYCCNNPNLDHTFDFQMLQMSSKPQQAGLDQHVHQMELAKQLGQPRITRHTWHVCHRTDRHPSHHPFGCSSSAARGGSARRPPCSTSHTDQCPPSRKRKAGVSSGRCGLSHSTWCSILSRGNKRGVIIPSRCCCVGHIVRSSGRSSCSRGCRQVHGKHLYHENGLQQLAPKHFSLHRLAVT